MTLDQFFTQPQRWSLRKHRILRKYLPPFFGKVGSRASSVFLVDGFAGPGKYEDGSPSSPLLTASLADESAKWRREKPVALKIVNIESNPTHYISLANVTKDWVHRGVVKNIEGEFGEKIGEALTDAGGSPALFFIDPYRPTDIPFAHLLPILTRAQKTSELIINFDTDGLGRIADGVFRTEPKSDSMVKMIQSFTARVNEVLGNDQWQAKLLNANLPTAERYELLLQEYMTHLSEYGYEVAAYGIRKSIDSSPKYHLVYCTRHFEGIRLMNNFFCEEEDNLLEEATTPSGQLVLSDEFNLAKQGKLDRRVELKRLILDYLQTNRHTTRGDIKRQLMFIRFGLFHETDYNAVVQGLLSQNRLIPSHGHKRINDAEPLTYQQ